MYRSFASRAGGVNIHPELQDLDLCQNVVTIDRLLAALTDTQIAALFGWSEHEVGQLRQARRTQFLKDQ